MSNTVFLKVGRLSLEYGPRTMCATHMACKGPNKDMVKGRQGGNGRMGGEGGEGDEGAKVGEGHKHNHMQKW